MQPLASVTAARIDSQGARTALMLAVIVASGFAGLGYQIVWTQQSALWLGHEAAAVLAVVAAFFGGIAVGSFALAEHIDRSAHAARWYAACEVLIGVWSLALALLVPRVASALVELIGPQPSHLRHALLSFAGTFMLLAPATIAMGGTLPAIERVLTNLSQREVRVATLYAGNTFGAVIGVLVSAFWLVPAFGLQRSASVCALLNFSCAAAASVVFSDAPPAPVRTHSPTHAPEHLSGHRLLWLLAATGLLGIGYEVVVVRVLSQVAENTVYTFALSLAVYLLGTSCGAAAYARWRMRSDAEIRGDDLLRLLAFACLAGIVSLSGAEFLRAALLQTFGTSMHVALLAEAALAVVAFLLPTMAMGALFSHLGAQARGVQISFGRVLGWNTLGAALAPILFGVWLLPIIGSTGSLLLIVACYALLAPRAHARKARWSLYVAVAACALWLPPLAFIHVPEHGRIVSRTEGSLATVSVIEDGDGVARLHINNRQQEGSSATAFADARQALLPLLLHAKPEHALFLGMGTGVTALAATLDPHVRVDVVELLPEVIAASDHFTRSLTDDLDRSRMHVMNADARRFIRATLNRYDLIVSDNFHPARSGSGTLYTLEHFHAVRARLSTDGVFCQWLPLHQLDLETLRSIVKTYATVFPHASAILATNSLETPVIGLIGRNDDGRFAIEPLRARLTAVAAAPRYGIEDEYALLGSFIADSTALIAFAGGAPLNTDDRPVVMYQAPQVTYAPRSLPRDRLIDLLHRVHVDPRQLLAIDDDARLQSRLTAYASARNRFIEAGRNVQPSSDVQRMLSQVREPLLQVLRTSPDFRPAYDPLLRMAQALTGMNPDAARALLLELERIQPERSEAAATLRDRPQRN